MPRLSPDRPACFIQNTFEADLYEKVRLHFVRLRELLDQAKPGRERSIVITKLDEAEGWLVHALTPPSGPTAEALDPMKLRQHWPSRATATSTSRSRTS